MLDFKGSVVHEMTFKVAYDVYKNHILRYIKSRVIRPCVEISQDFAFLKGQR